MADSETHLEVKVLFDKLKERVLFAEADGYFVDILFSFLTLPLGTIVRLIGKTQSEPSTLGGFTALHQSVMSLSSEYFFCDGLKDMLLHPRNFYEEECRRLKVNIDDTEAKYFVCGPFYPPCRNKHDQTFMSVYRNAKCPGCSRSMVNVVTPKPSSKGKVFVTKAMKFIITDDLQVTPVLRRTVIGHLSNIGIQDMSVVEERTVKLGINELRELLKLTLLSKTPLTDLFFPKKKQQGSSELKKPSPTENSDNAEDPGEARKIHVKMVVNKSSKELLYFEADEMFVDLLFSLLLIPLGEMLHIMEGQSLLGRIDGLYKSAQSLDSQYFISQDQRNILLRPKHHVLSQYNYLFHQESTDFTPSVDNWQFIMPVDIDFDGVNDSAGFMKEDILFIVLDNWVVTSASPASAVSMMSGKKLLVSDLEEMTVSIGMPKVSIAGSMY